MKVIVIEQLPEETCFYLLDEDGEDLKKTLAAHGEIINSIDSHDNAIFLSDKLSKLKKLDIDKPLDVHNINFDYVVWFAWII
jgi:hypothetical protein